MLRRQEIRTELNPATCYRRGKIEIAYPIVIERVVDFTEARATPEWHDRNPSKWRLSVVE